MRPVKVALAAVPPSIEVVNFISSNSDFSNLPYAGITTISSPLVHSTGYSPFAPFSPSVVRVAGAAVAVKVISTRPSAPSVGCVASGTRSSLLHAAANNVSSELANNICVSVSSCV